jgi:putative endonuclease
MSRSYYVYIMSSKSGVLYIGSTNDLGASRVREQARPNCRFHQKYRVTKLVYAEEFDSPSDMFARERQLKGWTRAGKLELIHAQNPEMVDYARMTARDPSLRSG